MKCDLCETDLPEHLIQESHDVPCYLFRGFNRKQKKNQADKFMRHWLCKKCHENYEEALRKSFKVHAVKFSYRWFNG